MWFYRVFSPQPASSTGRPRKMVHILHSQCANLTPFIEHPVPPGVLLQTNYILDHTVFSRSMAELRLVEKISNISLVSASLTISALLMATKVIVNDWWRLFVSSILLLTSCFKISDVKKKTIAVTDIITSVLTPHTPTSHRMIRFGISHCLQIVSKQTEVPSSKILFSIGQTRFHMMMI